MSYNAIGNFTFDSLLGEVKRASQTVELYHRPGVSGTGAFWGGHKGQPFVLQSVIGLSNRQTAIVRSQQYEATKGYLVEVSQAGLSAATFGQFLVIDAEVIVSKAIAASVGGLVPGARHWLEARWVLVHINN